MPVDTDFEAELATTDRHVSILKHNYALDLVGHGLWIYDLCFDGSHIIGEVVDSRVVLKYYQGLVATVRVNCHESFHCPLNLADKRVYLIVILLLQ